MSLAAEGENADASGRPSLLLQARRIGPDAEMSLLGSSAKSISAHLNQ